MSQNHVEIFLKWTAPGAHPEVKAWLQQHGLSARPMGPGLLVSGDRDVLARAFNVPPDHLHGPADVPIPRELAPHVASITIPKPRSYRP